MTEKRFEMVIVDVQGNFYYLDRVTDEKINSTLALEEKLNELANENKQLKKQIKDMQIRFKRKYDCEFDDIVDELD